MTGSTERSTTRQQERERDSDQRLANFAQRSPRAFGDLYERYLDRIYLYCLRRVGTQQAAEDLTADVFERALAKIDTFRGDSFRAWLFRIAHNAVTDHYRRRRDQVSWQPEMSGPDLAPGPEDYAIAREQRAHIRQLLELLTDDQREVVELRLSGLTGVEIAEVTGRKRDAIKMLQYRALERMRTHVTSSQANAENSDDTA